MSTEEKMDLEERYKYLRMMRGRYRSADRKTKGKLLDEMESVLGMHRKYLIDLMNSPLIHKKRKQERGRTYGPDVDDALRVIYETYDGICAERLTPNLVSMGIQLARHGELRTTPELLDQLGRISISTVQRILNRIRQDQPRLPRGRPKRGRRITRGIPMKRLSWKIEIPGCFESDLVHHCGPSASGEYLYTIQWIDVATGWSERRAVLGRGALVIEDAFVIFLARLPFPVLEIHPDNGTEFFNDHLLRFWGHRVRDVALSRSRPYHKNDNPRVEQKNSTLVRRYLGYDRLDTVEQVLAVNRVYDKMWVYYNLFQPVMHLAEKAIVQDDNGGTRVIRRHDKARTPFDRLCETDAITTAHREQLEALRDGINPRRLREQIYDDLDDIFQLSCAAPGSRQNVHLTLAKNLDRRKEPLSHLDFNCTSVD